MSLRTVSRKIAAKKLTKFLLKDQVPRFRHHFNFVIGFLNNFNNFLQFRRKNCCFFDNILLNQMKRIVFFFDLFGCLLMLPLNGNGLCLLIFIDFISFFRQSSDRHKSCSLVSWCVKLFVCVAHMILFLVVHLSCTEFHLPRPLTSLTNGV